MTRQSRPSSPGCANQPARSPSRRRRGNSPAGKAWPVCARLLGILQAANRQERCQRKLADERNLRHGQSKKQLLLSGQAGGCVKDLLLFSVFRLRIGFAVGPPSRPPGPRPENPFSLSLPRYKILTGHGVLPFPQAWFADRWTCNGHRLLAPRILRKILRTADSQNARSSNARPARRHPCGTSGQKALPANGFIRFRTL